MNDRYSNPRKLDELPLFCLLQSWFNVMDGPHSPQAVGPGLSSYWFSLPVRSHTRILLSEHLS